VLHKSASLTVANRFFVAVYPAEKQGKSSGNFRWSVIDWLQIEFVLYTPNISTGIVIQNEELSNDERC
jgi:hypothetical protein